ncbi:phenol hydroxylase [Pseudoxanthomonas kalamensis DSM 18571]|uniref:phenol hydroxylase subunit P4 n=1 Tax=Pseudoxanthomonas kalamensis TaxID=289483 RepID=UPI001391A725|nr:phenol hydroxylase subunit P4 [Pseudoxanthomonas kalamensis]KAF1711476.1 phenol hydroxylase [Pseudoxanthomonas kalamensis DSM 18571]
MAVKSTKPYVFDHKDSVAGFHGNQLVYASWDRHLLFAAPFLLYVSPDMTFRELVNGPITALIQPDPDASQVDWGKVEWLKANRKFTPDFDATLSDNGIHHKAMLRFDTPGLNSLAPQD